jgi:hypothetical protein
LAFFSRNFADAAVTIALSGILSLETERLSEIAGIFVDSKIPEGILSSALGSMKPFISNQSLRPPAFVKSFIRLSNNLLSFQLNSKK